MRAYVEFAVKKFQNNMAYRFEHLMGILNTILTFFVFWCIYRSLYGKANEVDGITFSMVVTNFIIALGLSNAFTIDEGFIERKVWDGTIVNEFLKPVNYKIRILSEDLGNSLFRVVFNFIPALLIAILFTNIEKPSSFLNLIFFTISIILGYLILWTLSFIVQMGSFWFFGVWGLTTIKNVFVNVLSGAMIPLWFMPKWIMDIIKYTPFDSIYFTPIKLYLGQMKGSDILFNFGRQAIWVFTFYVLGDILWRRGQKKLIVQGG